MNKIPPNFNTLFVTSFYVVRQIQGRTAWWLYKSFSSKE